MTSLQLPLQMHVRLVEAELGWVLLQREDVYPPQGEAAGDNRVMDDAASSRDEGERMEERQPLRLENALKPSARLIGCKIGLTSQAVQQQMDANQPDCGFLLGTMAILPGTVLACHTFIQLAH